VEHVWETRERKRKRNRSIEPLALTAGFEIGNILPGFSPPVNIKDDRAEYCLRSIILHVM
jgi:hypothetical protein